MNKIKTFLIIAGLFVTVGIMTAIFSETKLATAGAPSGLQTTVATSTAYSVSTSASTLFATSTACSSRIITTTSQPIMLVFSDRAGQVPTGTFGHLQSASTTVAYDSGIYGCNAYKAYGYGGSSNLTLTETR